MAAPTHLHDKTFSHEMRGSSVLRSRFIRALNLFPDEFEAGGAQPDAEASESSDERVAFENHEGNPFFRHVSESAPCQEMLAMDGIELPEFESLDALPSTIAASEAIAGALDEFSDDPDQLWFDETVTTMFMEDADKPKIETALVEPRMETRAWPLGVIAAGIDPAFTGMVEPDENAEPEIGTAAQLEAGDEISSAPTPDTFLITAKDEVDVDSADEPTPLPIKPRPVDDVPAPAQDLPFAAMLDARPAGESGKRGFGVKLAPGWKPLRGQKVNPPSKALASRSGADVDEASDAEQEWVQATLKTPRQDSILDGFGQFLEEQVILSAAIDEPDFKAMAPSFNNRDADSSSSDTEWQSVSLPTSSAVTPEAVSPEASSTTAPRVKTEWISGPPAGKEKSSSGVPWLAGGLTGEPQEAIDRDFGVAADDSNTESAPIEAAENFADDIDSGTEPSVSSLFTPENEYRADLTAAAAMEEPEVSVPASASDALPKSLHPITAPPLVADDKPRGFSASLLYGVEPAGSFFDDLEEGASSVDKEVDEDVDDSQPMAERVAPELAPGGDSVFPKAVETTDAESATDDASKIEADADGFMTPWGSSKLQEGPETDAVTEPELSIEAPEQQVAEVAEVKKNALVVSEQSEPIAPPPVNEIPVSALGYSHSRTNPALIKHGVSCPSCGVKLHIQARYLNIEGKCPGCAEMIVARQRGVVEPVVELATGRFPSFDRQPDLEPSDTPGGTVLSEGAADEEVTVKPAAPPVQGDPPATPSPDPFSNPNHELKKIREAAAGGVWGPTSGKGLS